MRGFITGQEDKNLRTVSFSREQNSTKNDRPHDQLKKLRSKTPHVFSSFFYFILVNALSQKRKNRIILKVVFLHLRKRRVFVLAFQKNLPPTSQSAVQKHSKNKPRPVVLKIKPEP
jgi:hypothetical protein